jgi:predicted nucleotidyltransferase
MRTSAPALLPIFRSDVQARLLALVFIRPEEPQAVSDLARRLGAHVATVQREVDRLEKVGILATSRVGRSRLVRPGTIPAYMPELRELILKVFGPARFLADALRAVDGVRQAYLFGSWAERYLGQPGPFPRDIDVVVIGEPDREQVYSAATEAERTIGLPVDIIIRSPGVWDDGNDPFVRTIRAGAMIRLDEGLA